MRVEDVVYVRNIVLSVERVLVSLQIKGCGLCREDCDISVLVTICGDMLFMYIRCLTVSMKTQYGVFLLSKGCTYL